MSQSRYIVQTGDTLQKISAKCMGSSSKWRILANHNNLQNPHQLKIGQTLEIPKDNKAFLKIEVSTNRNRRQHTVCYGDSLWNISAKYLGTPLRWREIASLNKLENGDHLFIGQTLDLPQGTLGASSKSISHPRDAQPIRPSLSYGAMEHRPATQVLARGFFFVIADEFNPLAKKFVRKVVYPEGLQDNPELLRQILNPEKYGFSPRNSSSKIPIGRHVLGMTDSTYVSVSTKFMGSPRFEGKKYWIDVEKLKKSGSQIYSAEDIAKDLDRIAAKTKDPKFLQYIEDIRYKSLVLDHENLIHGPIPPDAIKGLGAKALTHGMQFVQGVGIVLSVYDLADAGYQSYEKGTPRPIVAESIRQIGGWRSAALGFSVGASVGAFFGIETGPGALLISGGTGLVFGVAGYFGADWVADYIYEKG